MHKFSKKTLAVATAIALMAGGGAAYAYWSTTGSGTGTATNAASNGVVVLHANFAAGLAPGASVPVSYTATNAGTSNLYVSALTTPVVSVSPTTCLAGDFTVSVPTVTAANVPAGTTTVTGVGSVQVGSGTLAFANTLISQDECKNAVVTLTLSSS